MALGTITLIEGSEIEGGYSPLRTAEFTIVGDASYPAGGTAAFQSTLRTAFATQRPQEGSLSNLALRAVLAQDATAFDVRYDIANDKLIVRNLSDGAEVTGDQSGVTYRLMAFWG